MLNEPSFRYGAAWLGEVVPMTAILPMSPFSRTACAAPGAPWLPKERKPLTFGWAVMMSSAVWRARFWSSEAGKRSPPA